MSELYHRCQTPSRIENLNPEAYEKRPPSRALYAKQPESCLKQPDFVRGGKTQLTDRLWTLVDVGRCDLYSKSAGLTKDDFTLLQEPVYLLAREDSFSTKNQRFLNATKIPRLMECVSKFN